MARIPSSAPAPAELTGLDERELLQIVRSQPLPTHVAIIMDGNGRWATRRGFPRVAGHREGVKTARAVFRSAHELGLRYLTLYAFSTENWTRPEDEVSTLMRLLEEAVVRELPELMSRNVRLRVLGRSHGVPLPVRRGIERVVRATQHNSGLNLMMAFNYGGREELLDAFRALAARRPRVLGHRVHALLSACACRVRRARRRRAAKPRRSLLDDRCRRGARILRSACLYSDASALGDRA